MAEFGCDVDPVHAQHLIKAVLGDGTEAGHLRGLKMLQDLTEGIGKDIVLGVKDPVIHLTLLQVGLPTLCAAVPVQALVNLKEKDTKRLHRSCSC
jgi:hypothetical protein